MNIKISSMGLVGLLGFLCQCASVPVSKQGVMRVCSNAECEKVRVRYQEESLIVLGPWGMEVARIPENGMDFKGVEALSLTSAQRRQIQGLVKQASRGDLSVCEGSWCVEIHWLTPPTVQSPGLDLGVEAGHSA